MSNKRLHELYEIYETAARTTDFEGFLIDRIIELEAEIERQKRYVALSEAFYKLVLAERNYERRLALKAEAKVNRVESVISDLETQTLNSHAVKLLRKALETTND